MNTINTLKALANAKRFQILEYLKEPKLHFSSNQCDVVEDGICVGLIEEKIGLSQSTVSHYLSQMEKAGLITMERHGQWTYCKRNEIAIQDLIKTLEKL
ncbi:MAG: metalloregulator ArsR/SmtB family transcription factor [Gammaproteobacteria bacterium]|nr:metalloregulator ArsR/SmtB family transcription factor [Gammaproteobacteria bacterium]